MAIWLAIMGVEAEVPSADSYMLCWWRRGLFLELQGPDNGQPLPDLEGLSFNVQLTMLKSSHILTELNRPASCTTLKDWDKYSLTAWTWYGGLRNMFENPPDEKNTAVSGSLPIIAPILEISENRPSRIAKRVHRSDRRTGWRKRCPNYVQSDWPWKPDTPPSPAATMMDTPRAASCIYALQRVLINRNQNKKLLDNERNLEPHVHG